MKITKLFLLLAAVTLLTTPARLMADAGWDNGFYLKSEDGNFKMKIGGRMQFQEVVEKRSETKPTTPKAPGASNNFSDSFKIRRVRIQTTGTLFDKLDWFTVLNSGTAGGTATNFDTLWIAGFTYNLLTNFRISGGMVQLPMDRMGENSSAAYLGIEPPLTATQEDGIKALTIARDTLGLPFDLGIRFDGEVGPKFEYAFGVANGNGIRTANVNNELSYGARVMFNALGRVGYKETDFAWSESPNLSIGMGTGFEDEDAADPAGPTRNWSWSASGDVAFRYKGLAVNTELYYRLVGMSATSVEDTNGDKRLKDVGYYANAGYYVIPKKLEFTLTASQIIREGADNNANEFGGGLNWYIHNESVKFQFDYTNVLDYEDLPGLNNAVYHRFRGMFSMFI